MYIFSQYPKVELLASLQLSVFLNKEVGKVSYSTFNLVLLSFLCNRGFISSFKYFKEGSNGFITYLLRRINGSLVIKKIWSPSLKNSDSFSKFSKYKSYKALARFFSSEFVIVSTNQGLMTANEAIALRQGGIVICVLQ
jgi:ribosomal protein S8